MPKATVEGGATNAAAEPEAAPETVPAGPEPEDEPKASAAPKPAPAPRPRAAAPAAEPSGE